MALWRPRFGGWPAASSHLRKRGLSCRWNINGGAHVDSPGDDCVLRMQRPPRCNRNCKSRSVPDDSHLVRKWRGRGHRRGAASSSQAWRDFTKTLQGWRLRAINKSCLARQSIPRFVVPSLRCRCDSCLRLDGTVPRPAVASLMLTSSDYPSRNASYLSAQPAHWRGTPGSDASICHANSRHRRKEK